MLAAGLGSLQLGRTPTRLDTVTLAEVQRSRLGEVRRAIVGGLSAGDFPARRRLRALLQRAGALGSRAPRTRSRSVRSAAAGDGGVLPLHRPDARLGAPRAHAAHDRPRGRLAGSLAVHRGDPGGAPRTRGERAAARGGSGRPPRCADVGELAARVGAYIASRLDRRVAGRGVEPTPEEAEPADRRILTVYNHLVLPPGLVRRASAFLRETGRLWGYDNRATLPPEIVRRAIPNRRVEGSVSRLESFARCPYQHFARSMLRLQRRPEAEVTPLEGGLLTHKALEVLLKEGPLPDDAGEIARRLRKVFDAIEDEPDLRAFTVTPGGRLRRKTARGQLGRFLEIEARASRAPSSSRGCSRPPSARPMSARYGSPSRTAPSSCFAAGSTGSTSTARAPSARRS